MLKITIRPNEADCEFTLAYRHDDQSAWIPVDKSELRLPADITLGLKAGLRSVFKDEVTHFVNDGAIIFFKGQVRCCVTKPAVPELKKYAELIEARLTAKTGDVL